MPALSGSPVPQRRFEVVERGHLLAGLRDRTPWWARQPYGCVVVAVGCKRQATHADTGRERRRFAPSVQSSTRRSLGTGTLAERSSHVPSIVTICYIELQPCAQRLIVDDHPVPARRAGWIIIRRRVLPPHRGRRYPTRFR